MKRSLISAFAIIGLVSGAITASPVWAAPPSNDNRADAIRVTPPQTVVGTLVDATLEPTNDVSECEDTEASVWYRFTAPKSGAIIIELDADGEMDAAVDVFQQVRSKLDFVDCAGTDRKGVATIDTADLEPGAEYSIRVGRQLGSVADTFTMRVLIPSPAPRPPGKPLPAGGAKGSVDRLVNSGDAYWSRMREGVTMRVSLRVNQCTALQIYGPGTRDFDGDTVMERRCGGYALFTPEESGRYFLVVWAGRSRDTQRYRLRVAPARRDDTSPGIFIGNNARVTGKVNGGIDSRDLFRFDVPRRSELRLWVTGSPQLRLVSDNGARYGVDSSFDLTVRPGRYYVAVEGSGKYTLHRVSRTITRSQVRFNGRQSTTVTPGSGVQIAMRVSPAVSGPAVMVLERRDAIDGWQFVRRYRVMVSNGSAQASFTPDVGHYRVSAEFKGTRTSAPSQTSYARLRAQGPLVG